MNGEFERFDALFEKVKSNEKLMLYLARAVEGAEASTQNLDGIAEKLYLIGNQGGKTAEDIKMELKGFAAGLVVNKAVHERETA